MSEASPVFAAGGGDRPPVPGAGRSFGLLFAGIFALASAYLFSRGSSWAWVSGAVATGLVFAAIVAPERLHSANLLWLRLALLLGRIVNPVVMAVMFFGIITPIGWLMRAFGKRPLSLDFDRAAASYWIVRRPPGPARETMRSQF